MQQTPSCLSELDTHFSSNNPYDQLRVVQRRSMQQRLATDTMAASWPAALLARSLLLQFLRYSLRLFACASKVAGVSELTSGFGPMQARLS